MQSMQLSNFAIEAMGFRPVNPDESYSAQFHCIRTFAVQGLTLPMNTTLQLNGRLGKVEYQIGVGNSVNVICRRLVQDDLVPDEAEWAKAKGGSPPYLMLLLGPTSEHTSTATHVKVEDKQIATYDGFRLAHLELRSLEDSIVPNLVSVLSCELSQFHDAFRLVPLDRHVFGRTEDGRTVFDIRFTGHGVLTTARAIEESDLSSRLARALALAPAISPKISRFFHLALDETDPLKRFLYIFLTIERHTHATFQKIDHSLQILHLVKAPDRVKTTVSEFLLSQTKQWKNLLDRFTWCTITEWNHLDDKDIANFKALKDIRDQITHGEITSPPAESVLQIERLAKKLQFRSGGME
jgi:hypothetical protein